MWNGFDVKEQVCLLIFFPFFLGLFSQLPSKSLDVEDCIVGGFINQDGRSAGLTAPNGAAQQRLIRSALSDASLSKSSVSCIEAHGTGTPLGDPIEMNAVMQSYGGGSAPLIAASVKANVGHLETSAGILSLLKILSEFGAKKKFRQVNFRQLNPQIVLEDVVIPVEEVEMTRRHSVGISSFGFTGTNAHVIVQKARSEIPQFLVVARQKPWWNPIWSSFVDVLENFSLSVAKVTLRKHAVAFYVERKTKIVVPSSLKLAFSCSTGFRAPGLRQRLRSEFGHETSPDVALTKRGGFTTKSGGIQAAVAVWKRFAEWGLSFHQVTGQREALLAIGANSVAEWERLSQKMFVVEVGRGLQGRDPLQLGCFHVLGKARLVQEGTRPLEFVRQSFWIGATLPAEPKKQKQQQQQHHHHHRPVVTGIAAKSEQEFVEAVDLKKDPPYTLADHLVYDVVIMPGASHLSRIVQICCERLKWLAVELQNVVFLTPVVLDLAKDELFVHYKFVSEKSGALFKWEVSTAGKLHARGEARPLKREARGTVKRLHFDESSCVRKPVKLQDRGLFVTPDYALIESVLVSPAANESCSGMRPLNTRFVAATQYLDAMFLTCVALMAADSLEHFWAPFALTSLRFWGTTVQGNTHAEGKLLAFKKSRATFECNMFDANGNLLVEMDRFTILEAPSSSMFPPDEYFQKVCRLFSSSFFFVLSFLFRSIGSRLYFRHRLFR
jgi:hypothetical protein